jgi:hypothetical protein
MKKSPVFPLLILVTVLAASLGASAGQVKHAAVKPAVKPAAAKPPAILVVKDPAALPRPFASMARPGDVFITDGRAAALIATTPRTAWSAINYGYPDIAGYVAAFLPPGASARPDVQFGYPLLKLEGKAVFATPGPVAREGAAIVARSLYRGSGGTALDILVRYTFDLSSGRIDIAAEVRNAGEAEVKGLSFSLGTTSWQSYLFGPYNADRFPNLAFRVYERPDHALGWLALSPVEKSAKDPLPGSLKPGAVYRLSNAMFTAAAVPDLLDRLYRAVRVPAAPVRLEVKKFEGPAEIVVRDPATGALFFRTFVKKPGPLAFTVPLPPGTYSVQANLFPAVVEKAFAAVSATEAAKDPKANDWTVEAPAFGRVRVVLADRKGRPVPGKATFIGLAPTATPYFGPENPIVTGRAWETRKNAVYPVPGGLDVSLPAGTYLVTASRGPEYDQGTLVSEILAGEPRELRFTIDRALATPGLVSVDPHMHTLFSDGSVSVAERLRSAVAEGLDAVVSADHNWVTDYRPELERLGFAGEIAFVPGSEVTARTGSIHFNMIPAPLVEGDPASGSIGVRDETPAVLFAAARAKQPGTIVQLNHPRSGTLGYFNNYHLDPEKAAFADHGFDLGFDVMEAMNGAVFGGGNDRAVEDWFHLVNRGYPVRIVGSSDAHGVDGGETGYSRTYVLMPEPAAGGLDQDALLAGLRNGRSFVSNGPIVSVKANGKATFGDLVAAKKGRVDLDIAVTGAPWLDVSEVRLVINGERREPLPLAGADGGTLKFKGRVRVETPRDGWIAVEVKGSRSLFPVAQQRAGDGTPKEAALPYALTNPIFVDANGDGRSDPVWPEKVVVK